jgi:hypothetical protein
MSQTADQIDFSNGRAGFLAGAPLSYYDYSGAAHRGWKSAQREHEDNNAASDAAGYPQDQSQPVG